MFAVVKTGGKQYRVEQGSIVEIEKVSGNKGETVTFDQVLMVAGDGTFKVGQPLVSGAKVSAEIVDQTRGPKLRIFKKIRRHGKQLRKGHRQDITRVRITQIVG